MCQHVDVGKAILHRQTLLRLNKRQSCLSRFFCLAVVLKLLFLSHFMWLNWLWLSITAKKKKNLSWDKYTYHILHNNRVEGGFLTQRQLHSSMCRWSSKWRSGSLVSSANALLILHCSSQCPVVQQKKGSGQQHGYHQLPQHTLPYLPFFHEKEGGKKSQLLIAIRNWV